MNDKKQKITVPLSFNDMEMIMLGEEYNWTFPTQSGEEIDVCVRLEKQEDMDDIDQANDMVDGNGDMISLNDINDN